MIQKERLTDTTVPEVCIPRPAAARAVQCVIVLALQPSTSFCTLEDSSLTKRDDCGGRKSRFKSKLSSLEFVALKMELPQCFPRLCLCTKYPPELNPSFLAAVFEVFNVWEILELCCRLT